MLHPIPQRRIAVSLLVLASYLCAAFLDCHPEASIGVGAPAFHGHARGPEADHAGHARGPARMAGHSGHAASAPPADRENHAGHADRPTPHDPQAVRVASKHAVLKATCACGCGDTRARVGGGTSRLGAVVPGVFVARLLEMTRVDGAGPAPGLFPDPCSALEPIPI